MADRASWLAAGVLAAFGRHRLRALRRPVLWREARIARPAAPAGLAGAYAMGLAFGFGWTPCVGPSLAAILRLAAGGGGAGTSGAEPRSSACSGLR